MKHVAAWVTSLALLAAAPASAQITGPTFPTDGPPVPAQSTQITIKKPKKKSKKRRARSVLRAVSRAW
jgi:hypothetical protein